MKLHRIAVATCAALLAVVGGAQVRVHKAPAERSARITAAQARRVALRKYPGTVVGKVPLENEDGKWQYAVTVRSHSGMHEIMVDAHTGKIGSVEKVTAAEERAEERAEAAKSGKGAAGHVAGAGKHKPAKAHGK